MKIYWREIGVATYEFYIGTGQIRKSANLKCVVEEFNIINIVRSRRVGTNKRGRLKKFLFNPPINSIISTGKSWCVLKEDEKKLWIELDTKELTELYEKYEII